MKLPFWLKSSPPNHIPSTLVLRLIPDLELPEPPRLAMASVAPNPCPPGLAELATALCPRMACREQGVTHTGSHEFSTAARLATGPLAEGAPLCLCDEEEDDKEAWEGAAAAFPESLLELELELELDGLRLSRELENFHWGIFGMSMQNVVVASCSPSRQGESARAGAPVEDEVLALGSRGGKGRLGVEEGTTGVATTLPLMAKLCIRSSEEVTDSLRKRPYFGLRSIPGGAAWSRSWEGGTTIRRWGGGKGKGEGGGLMDEGAKTGKKNFQGGVLYSCQSQLNADWSSSVPTHAHTLSHSHAALLSIWAVLLPFTASGTLTHMLPLSLSSDDVIGSISPALPSCSTTVLAKTHLPEPPCPSTHTHTHFLYR